jgi:hypothetical protein
MRGIVWGIRGLKFLSKMGNDRKETERTILKTVIPAPGREKDCKYTSLKRVILAYQL